MSERYDLIVIGAGISGLAMAFEAQQAGKKVLVLERDERAGGCFQSAAVEGDEPFWLEMGTHTCFNSYGRLLKLLAGLGLMDQLTPRQKLSYRMLADGKLSSIPSLLNFLELALNGWRLFSLNKEGRSVAGYYGAIVGKQNYRNVFRHAFSAVICQEADEVPADMLFRKRPRNKEVMRSYTFPEGLGRIISELAARLELRIGQQVQAIRKIEAGYAVETKDTVFQAGSLACATPAQAASRLLHKVDAELSERLGWISEVEIESVGIVVSKLDLPLEPVAGIIAADGDFYSAVSRDVVEHPAWRGLTFHFKPGQLSNDEKLERICALLEIEPSQLAAVFHKINRLPAPDMGHHRLIQEIDGQLQGKPLALVGNYFGGVAVEDCLARVESELARLAIL